MSLLRAFLSLSALTLAALPLLAQPNATEPLPEGARLRLGSPGLALGENVQGAALSPDGKYLVAASQNMISLIELKTGKTISQIGGNGMPLSFPAQIAFANGGKVMAYASVQNVVLVEIPSGKQLHQLEVTDANFFRGRDLTFSADGKVVAVGMEQQGKQKIRAFAWDVATGKALGTFEVAQNAGCSTALSPDGKMLATWGRHFARMIGEDQTAGQTVQLWDLATGKELRQIKMDRPNAQITAAAFAPDGKTLTVASGMSSFHVYDTASGKAVKNFAGRRSNVSILRYSPDGKMLAAGSNFEGVVQAWNAEGKRIEIPAGPRARLLSFAFPGDGQLLALGMVGQSVAWWDATSGKTGSNTTGHQTPVVGLGFAADGKSLTSASVDGKIVSWDAASGKILRQLTLSDEETIRAMGMGGQRFNMLCLSPDGRFVATNSIFNSIRLWDMANGQVVCDFEPSKQAGSYGSAFARKGNRLVAAGTMKLINIWDTEAGQEVGKITYETQGNNIGGALRVALSPDGKLLALLLSSFDPQTGMPGAKIALLDAVNGKELHSHNVPAVTNFNNFGSGVQFGSSVAFSDDSKFVALPGPNQTVLVLRADSGKEYKRLETTAEFADINGLAFSPDGRTVAVAHGGQRNANPMAPMVGPEKSALEICELASGKSRALFKGQHGRIYCLAFSPDGATVASGSSDTTVVLWDVAGRHGPMAIALNAGELDAAWGLLAKLEGPNAFAAQRKLIASPAETVAFLDKHLPPARPPAIDPKKVERWVADLDSENFETRDDAYRALDQLGAVAEATLRKARAGKISLEMRRRIDDLVDKLERGVLTPEEVQAARAVEVLERIGTAEARTMLAALAACCAPTATLTLEARKALGRMK